MRMMQLPPHCAHHGLTSWPVQLIDTDGSGTLEPAELRAVFTVSGQEGWMPMGGAVQHMRRLAPCKPSVRQCSIRRPGPNHPLSTRRRWAAPPRCARSHGSCSLWRGRAPPAFASPTLLRSGAAGRRCCRVGLGGTAARMRLYVWTHLALALHLKGEDWLLITQQRADVRLMAIRKRHSHHRHLSHSHRSR